MFSIADSKLQSLMSVDLNEIAKPKPINEDININPEDNTVHFIAILLECLALLRRLPEAIDVSFFFQKKFLVDHFSCVWHCQSLSH